MYKLSRHYRQPCYCYPCLFLSTKVKIFSLFLQCQFFSFSSISSLLLPIKTISSAKSFKSTNFFGYFSLIQRLGTESWCKPTEIKKILLSKYIFSLYLFFYTFTLLVLVCCRRVFLELWRDIFLSVICLSANTASIYLFSGIKSNSVGQFGSQILFYFL